MTARWCVRTRVRRVGGADVAAGCAGLQDVLGLRVGDGKQEHTPGAGGALTAPRKCAGLAVAASHPVRGAQYFFRILDVRKQGALTNFSIAFFFREVAALMFPPGSEDAVRVRGGWACPRVPPELTPLAHRLRM